MKVENCLLSDVDAILSLYESARTVQLKRKMVVWPLFEKSFVEKEIREQRQFKLIIDDVIACNWAITFEDKDIWEEREKGDAIYIHRIATHPDYRGNRYIDKIVEWAKDLSIQKKKKFIRLDTLGNNTKLIEHYTSAGFKFLGIVQLTNTANLPGHYHTEPRCCLFELAISTDTL